MSPVKAKARPRAKARAKRTSKDVPAAKASEPLALFGGSKAVTGDHRDLFAWPIVTKEDERAVLAVLRAGTMSGLDVTRQFEKEFAAWMGLPYALAHCNGTAALQAAMYACGVRRGDEVICPSMTYWASGLPALTLGATIVWADIQRHSLCLDPSGLAERITPRTRAIVAVHYCGYPADMDEIMAIANARGVKVIEDVSHAQGGMYKGRKLGTIGQVAAMSIMSGKALPAGEGGMLATADREIFQRAIAWGHYERHGQQSGEMTLPELTRYAGLPLGGVKHRINQLASAMGRVQLRHYDRRNAEILRAMNYFWDALEGTPGIRAHRPGGTGILPVRSPVAGVSPVGPCGTGVSPAGSPVAGVSPVGRCVSPTGPTRMGGWYNARGLYVSEELGGLPLARFCEALSAEGFPTSVGANAPLHLHAAVNQADIYGDGRPTILANVAPDAAGHARDVRAPAGSLPVSEAINDFCFGVPWFKRFRPKAIDQYVRAVKKVVARAAELK